MESELAQDGDTRRSFQQGAKGDEPGGHGAQSAQCSALLSASGCIPDVQCGLWCVAFQERPNLHRANSSLRVAGPPAETQISGSPEPRNAFGARRADSSRAEVTVLFRPEAQPGRGMSFTTSLVRLVRSPSVESSASLQKVQTNLHQSGHPKALGLNCLRARFMLPSGQVGLAVLRPTAHARGRADYAGNPVQHTRRFCRSSFPDAESGCSQFATASYEIHSRCAPVIYHYVMSVRGPLAAEAVRWLRRPCEEPWRVPRSCSRGARLCGQLRPRTSRTISQPSERELQRHGDDVLSMSAANEKEPTSLEELTRRLRELQRSASVLRVS